MHPGMHTWWRHLGRGAAAAAADCFAWAGLDPEEPLVPPRAWGLARRLGLDESQAREVARVLEELDTERAQAAVDRRRMAARLADELVRDHPDADRIAAAAGLRVESAERLRLATVRALDRLHRVLGPAQRAALASLVRSGVVVL
jgi:hypothetical protein